MKLYTAANEAHPASTVVKSADAAENLRALVGLDIRFMVGCDEVWKFSDDDDAGPAAAADTAAAATAAAPPRPLASISKLPFA